MCRLFHRNEAVCFLDSFFYYFSTKNYENKRFYSEFARSHTFSWIWSVAKWKHSRTKINHGYSCENDWTQMTRGRENRQMKCCDSLSSLIYFMMDVTFFAYMQQISHDSWPMLCLCVLKYSSINCVLIFCSFPRNQCQQSVFSIEMTTTVCTAKMLIWLQNQYSNQRPLWKQWHRMAKLESTTFAWAKEISKFFCVNCYWLKIIVRKYIRRRVKQMNGQLNSKDLQATWSNSKICCSTTLKWWSAHRSSQSIWSKRDSKRYDFLHWQ